MNTLMRPLCCIVAAALSLSRCWSAVPPPFDEIQEAARAQLEALSGRRIVMQFVEEKPLAVSDFRTSMERIVSDHDRIQMDDSLLARHPRELWPQIRENFADQREQFAGTLRDLAGQEGLFQFCSDFRGRLEIVLDQPSDTLRLTRTDERDIHSLLDAADPHNALVEYLKLNTSGSSIIVFERDTHSTFELDRNRLIVTHALETGRRDWLIESLGVPLVDWSLLRNPVLSWSGSELNVTTSGPHDVRWECTLDRSMGWKLTRLRTGVGKQDQTTIVLSDFIRVDDTWLPGRAEVTEFDIRKSRGVRLRKTLTLLEYYPAERWSLAETTALPTDEHTVVDGVGFPHPDAVAP
ncbi:MAG: hypothetical protein KF858_03325 [Candidatus Sumerlaeia bacterium]|nr:hypothetical protein [Candidatus Sumerlaeia bacterium]